jgi:hypothetical protein
MAQANNVSIISPSRFHNLADPALADALGHADAVQKGAEAECKLLKDEFKRRGLVEVAGCQFTVTATEQIAGRLDTKAVKEGSIMWALISSIYRAYCYARLLEMRRNHYHASHA